jgi:hypothetical protein
MMFGDEVSRNQYLERVQAARMAQTVPFAVAPARAVNTRKRTFSAGDEIRREDLDVVTGGASPMVVMDSLIREGLVIAAEHVPRGVPHQIGTIATGHAITSPRGILGPRDGVSKDDFSPETLALLVAKGRVLLEKAARGR